MKIQWPDGSMTEADNAIELLDKIRMFQWDLLPSDEFRRLMARRAYVWSGTRIFPYAEADDFVAALADAGMFRIVGGKAVDAP